MASRLLAQPLGLDSPPGRGPGSEPKPQGPGSGGRAGQVAGGGSGLRPVPRPGAVFDPRCPGAADRLGRPRAPGIGLHQSGQVHQFPRDPALSQERATLWAGRRAAAHPQGPHRDGHGGLHRLHRGPPVRVWQCGGGPRHSIGRAARPDLKAVRRPHRAGPRRRRGRPEADQRGARTVHQPERRPADPDVAGGVRSLRVPAGTRGRRLPRAARNRGGRCPGARLPGLHAGDRPGAGHPRGQRGPGAAGGDRGQSPAASVRHDPRGPLPPREDLAAVGGQFPRARGERPRAAHSPAARPSVTPVRRRGARPQRQTRHPATNRPPAIRPAAIARRAPRR